MYAFWYDYLKPKEDEKNQNCFIWMQRDLLYTKKQMTFIKTLWKMLKLGLMLQIMNQIDHCLKKKIKIVARLMKSELGGKTMIKFVRLRVKPCSYLDDNSVDKKAKRKKKCVIKI